jgi:5,10-methylenetetrahydromethanopterin reductase
MVDTSAATTLTERAPKVGFFFWPDGPDMAPRMGELAETYGFDLVGVADTPGQALDCWVTATQLTAAAPNIPIAICVSNFTSRHWTSSAAAAASLAMIHRPGFILGMGSGHSAMRNFGMNGATVDEMAEGLGNLKRLVKGESVPNGTASAWLSWARQSPQVFLAASHERSLRLAGEAADGVFINFGLQPDNIAQSIRQVNIGAQADSTAPANVWQVAALICTEDGDKARAQVGKVAFGAGYIIGGRDPVKRGVPSELAEPMRELVRSYSTRPSQADIDLVHRLGLFEYLSKRLAVCGNPEECLEQIRAAARAGADKLMFSVGPASQALKTIELVGRHVLPALRSNGKIASHA